MVMSLASGGGRVCLLFALLPGSVAWRAGAPQPRSRLLTAARRGAAPLACDSGSESSDAGLFASLRARQQTLEDELSERWREAKCASKVPLTLTLTLIVQVPLTLTLTLTKCASKVPP